MVDRRGVDENDATQIGLRIKACRVLSNLNQESFANRFGIVLTSIKNWELGRSIPRQEAVEKFIAALTECGVLTTRNWILFGQGSGPRHGVNEISDSSSAQNRDDGFAVEIAHFERACLKENRKPLVARVVDDLMEPFFFDGDVIGAEEVTIAELESLPERALKHPYVIEISPGEFVPRILCRDALNHLSFCRTIGNESVSEIGQSWVGRVVWLRRSHLVNGDKKTVSNGKKRYK